MEEEDPSVLRLGRWRSSRLFGSATKFRRQQGYYQSSNSNVRKFFDFILFSLKFPFSGLEEGPPILQLQSLDLFLLLQLYRNRYLHVLFVVHLQSWLQAPSNPTLSFGPRYQSTIAARMNWQFLFGTVVRTASGSPKNALKKVMIGRRNFREALDDDEVPVLSIAISQHHLIREAPV